MIKKVLANMVKTYKDWVDKLPFVIVGYNTTMQTAIGETSYSFMFGGEAVLAIET